MPADLKTTLTELPDSRVRLRVEVPAEELEGRLEHKARQLGRELKLPGFRRGKVPAPLVIQRVGREAVLEQAVRETLSHWYSDAIETAGIVPVGDPDVDLGELPPQGQALEFSIEIGVLPKAQLDGYRGLEAPRRTPEVGEEQIEQEIEAMRERLARLETVERAAGVGDFVVVDYLGSRPGEGAEAQDESTWQPFAGGEGRDQLVELGGGNLIPGFEEGLTGMGAGETRTIRVTFPQDYGNGELAGREASFTVTVKEVKEKQLPQLDEDFAIDAGFDDVQELRQDIRRRLTEAEQERIEAEFRQAALDAAVARAQVATTPELVQGRTREMWERMLHSLAHRGVSRETYLELTGREEEQVLAEMEADAERALRREAVLTAIVEAESLSPSEEELLEAVGPSAEREGVSAQKLIERLRKAGRLEELRDELAARKAIDLLAAEAKPISVGEAQAKEQLWTPAKASQEQVAAGGEREGQAGRLWTPDR